MFKNQQFKKKIFLSFFIAGYLVTFKRVDHSILRDESNVAFLSSFKDGKPQPIGFSNGLKAFSKLYKLVNSPIPAL